MKGLRKKALVLAAVTVFAMSSLAGCSRDYTVDNDKVAVKVGDSEISLGVLNFYLRYNQADIEETYAQSLGTDFWKTQIAEGITFEDNQKESTINALTQMYILEDHMSEFGVEVTSEELTAIEKAADDFIAANAENSSLVSGDKEIIQEVLRMATISTKMYMAMIEDVSTEVSDFEAAQKKLAYLGFTETENVTLEEAKAEAELFLEDAKKKGDLMELAKEQQAPSHEFTFDSKTTTISKKIVEAADKLKAGEFADIIEDGKIYYVVQLISEFDKDATQAKKDQIVADRQAEKFESLYKPWQDATEIVIDDSVVADISLHGLQVKPITKE